MKKWTTVWLVLLLLFCLVACGKESGSDGKEAMTDTVLEETDGAAAEVVPDETDSEETAKAPTKQQLHVAKTYNGEYQGDPIQAEVSYVDGIEIIRYEGLPNMVNMIATGDNYFYVEDERGYSGGINRIMDRYGNIFCQEKLVSYELWDVRTNRTGLQDDSFVIRERLDDGSNGYYWYSQEGDLLKDITYLFEAGDGTSRSIQDMHENVLIMEVGTPGEWNASYHYYDMENDFKLIAIFDGHSLYRHDDAPVINEGYCYIHPEEMELLTVYDDSRITFGCDGFTEDWWTGELYRPYLKRLLGDDEPSIYSPETGWILGEGEAYGLQAYNVKTGKMLNITSWDDQPNGSYFCYWWENEITNYPYEFEKDGIMLLSVADHDNPGWNHAVLYDINAEKRVNDQVYEMVNVPDYKERPMLYTQDPDHWYGYLDEHFEPMATYADATTFSNGYALVSEDKKTYSIVNEKLEVVVQDAFEANCAVDKGHGLFELGYSEPSDPYNYTSYKYVYIGPE